MRNKDWFAVIVMASVLSFLTGLCVGSRIISGYYKQEIARINADLDEAKAETRCWQNILKGLADGNQLEGIDIKHGRPSVDD